jgi:hypothetical protein
VERLHLGLASAAQRRAPLLAAAAPLHVAPAHAQRQDAHLLRAMRKGVVLRDGALRRVQVGVPPSPSLPLWSPSRRTCTMASYMRRSARRPCGVSRLESDRSTPLAARRSPRVSAPSDCSGRHSERHSEREGERDTVGEKVREGGTPTCSRRATADAKRFSPPRSVVSSLYLRVPVCVGAG